MNLLAASARRLFAPLATLVACALALPFAARANPLPSAPEAATRPFVQEVAQPSASATPGTTPSRPGDPPQPDQADYSLPFFGADAIRAGATLPLPIGISILGQYQREDIRSHDLSVGLGGAPLIDASFVGFGEMTTRVRNLLFRGDIWIFPFLNLYGIAGESWSSTTVQLTRPIAVSTVVDSQGTTLGFGGTLAYGIEPYGFVTVDANLTWADQSILDTPERTLTITPRVGHRWLSETHPGRGFSLWAGMTMEEFENRVVGNLPLSGVLGSGTNIPLPGDFGTWYQTLTPAQQQNVGSLLSQLIALEQNPNSTNASAAFNLMVRPSKAWNLVLGGEMDLNKHWQLVAEGGLLGARTSVVGNLCYRFGI